jgi:hypothetical protein
MSSCVDRVQATVGKLLEGSKRAYKLVYAIGFIVPFSLSIGCCWLLLDDDEA